MTPSILSVRSDLALCSPTTQLMASAILLFAAAVRPDNRRDPFIERDVSAIAKGLESDEFQFLDLVH